MLGIGFSPYAASDEPERTLALARCEAAEIS